MSLNSSPASDDIRNLPDDDPIKDCFDVGKLSDGTPIKVTRV